MTLCEKENRLILRSKQNLQYKVELQWLSWYKRIFLKITKLRWFTISLTTPTKYGGNLESRFTFTLEVDYSNSFSLYYSWEHAFSFLTNLENILDCLLQLLISSPLYSEEMWHPRMRKWILIVLIFWTNLESSISVFLWWMW